jgi:hypothetical protein
LIVFADAAGDGVEADSDFALKVATDRVRRKAEPLPGSLIFGTVIVMTGTFWMGPVGLEGVSPVVDEELEIIRHHAGGALRRSSRILSSLMSDRRHRYFMFVVKQ